jgi:hypothetical protein
VDPDPLKPSSSTPPEPPLGEQGEPRPPGLAERSELNPPLTATTETRRSSDRPPVPTQGAGGTGQPSLERLSRELKVIREEIRHLHEMTLELPDIFENKFRQRLGATLRQQRLLLAENAALKRKLLELGPAAREGPRPPLLLPPARTEPVEPLESHARPGLVQSLRQAWGGLAGGRSSATLKGDEPTRDGLADPKHK